MRIHGWKCPRTYRNNSPHASASWRNKSGMTPELSCFRSYTAVCYQLSFLSRGSWVLPLLSAWRDVCLFLEVATSSLLASIKSRLLSRSITLRSRALRDKTSCSLLLRSRCFSGVGSSGGGLGPYCMGRLIPAVQAALPSCMPCVCQNCDLFGCHSPVKIGGRQLQDLFSLWRQFVGFTGDW